MNLVSFRPLASLVVFEISTYVHIICFTCICAWLGLHDTCDLLLLYERVMKTREGL